MLSFYEIFYHFLCLSVNNAWTQPWISFADFAIAMLDEVEQPKHSRQRFTVGY